MVFNAGGAAGRLSRGRVMADLVPLEAVDSLFTGFKHTAYRLETLDRYTVGYEEEELRRFLAGEPKPPPGSKDRWWARVIAEAVATGRRMERVHVVEEPLTDYLRWEIGWGYPENVEIGEDVRIRPVPRGSWPEDVPHHDYWMFDSATVVNMHYDEEGRFLGCQVTEDPAVVQRSCFWRDAAWHDAIPVRDYLAMRPRILERA